MKKIFTLMIMVSAIFTINIANASEIERERPNKNMSTNDERVEGSAQEIYSVYLSANESVSVSVVGDGDTDLDLYIFDVDDNIVTYDTDFTDICTCEFTPECSGYYTIVVKNCGKFVNYYSIEIS